MSKTKYPNQIDTPVELPIVRDNIFEIGSDAINSLRSAIIQIEKTLGINPQGAVGETVGSRISRSIDSSGNLLPEALDRVGIISGPIFDDQVSEVAAIKESKLRLNFPTNVLQAEISSVASLIDEIQSQIEELSAKLSAHVSPDASGRHKASSISTIAIANTESSSGLRDVGISNVQDVIGAIFSSHINYDGTSISDTNNSHGASQIFFDNSQASNVESSDVQGAIEDIAILVNSGVVEHQDLLHSNGVSRAGYITDVSNAEYGTLIFENETSSVFENLGSKPYFEVTLDTPFEKPISFGIGDMIELTVSGEKTEYQVYQIQYDDAIENIVGFFLFGTFKENMLSVSTTAFLKRHREYNSIGLIASGREKYGLSSSDTIQIINPDAVFVISSGIKPAEITSSNRYFGIKINGTSYSFDVYNSAISTQSVESIIKAINETVDSLSLPILAYRKVLEGGGTELVIAANISSADVNDLSIEITRSDDSIDSLGLSGYESKIIYGQIGTSYYIGGQRFTGLLKKVDATGFEILGSTRTVSSGTSDINFITSGVKIGDILNILDTDVNSYEITAVTESFLTLSSRQLPSGFSATIENTVRLIIYESSALVNSLEFSNVTADIGSSLLEIFVDKNRFINTNLVLEQESAVYIDKSIYSVVEFNNPGSSTSVEINFENTTDGCVNIFLDESSDIKKVVGNFSYINLKSNIGNFSCDIFVQDKSSLYNYVAALGGTLSTTIYPSESINDENNLLIAKVVYSNFIGKFDGGTNGALFLQTPSTGTIGIKDIASSITSVLSERPISELRSSGVIFGLEVTDVSGLDGYASGIYTVSISSGVCYVDGKRFEIFGSDNINTGIDSSVYDKLYVGIDSNGNIVFATPDPNCAYPWEEEKTLLLYTIENDGASFDMIDQRLFVGNLDTRILNSITVSPQKDMGHFTDIVKAIRYAKRFSQIYASAGVPEIKLKAGTHTVSMTDTTTRTYLGWLSQVVGATATAEKQIFYNNLIRNGIFIDFPVSIIGEGSSTIIEIVYNLSASDGDRILTGAIIIPGAEFNNDGALTTTPHDTFSSGRITLSNFKMKESGISLIDLVNYFGASDNYLFKVNIENIIFSFEDAEDTKTSFYRDIRFFETSDDVSYKGNVSIKGCVFQNDGCIMFNPAALTTPLNYKHIFVEDNETDRPQGVSNPELSDTDYFPSGNNIWSLGNTIVSGSSVHKIDRVSCSLLVPEDLIAGSVQTLDNYLFGATKTYKKSYWLYQGQIIYQYTSNYNYEAIDPFTYSRIVGTERITSSAVGGVFTAPYVNVLTNEFVSVPVDIAMGQTITSIRVIGGTSGSSTLSISIKYFSQLSDSGTTIYTSGTITRNASYAYFNLDNEYTPDGDYSHIISIKNLSGATESYTRVILTYGADNLFELFGIN